MPVSGVPSGTARERNAQGRGFFEPRRNLILRLLPPESAQVLRELTAIPLTFGEMIYEPGQRQRYVYFPTCGTVSTLVTVDSGATVELGMVGWEGVVGYAALLGGVSSTTQSIVQMDGEAYRMDATAAEAFLQNDQAFNLLVRRYAQVLLTQASVTAACVKHHSVIQQLSRWILITHDRTVGDVFYMTQDLMAIMLGARREAINIAATRLKSGGLIDYQRGRVAVLNRKGLEAAACSCYEDAKAEANRILPDVARAERSSDR